MKTKAVDGMGRSDQYSSILNVKTSKNVMKIRHCSKSNGEIAPLDLGAAAAAILANISTICFIFQNDKMLTLPSFQSAFARTRLDDDPFNTVAGSTTTTASTIGRSIINHGLKPSAEIFSTVTVTGNKSIPATHQLKSR